MTSDFWYCEKCKEQYRWRILDIRSGEIAERILLLEEQAELHDKEHHQ